MQLQNRTPSPDHHYPHLYLPDAPQPPRPPNPPPSLRPNHPAPCIPFHNRTLFLPHPDFESFAPAHDELWARLDPPNGGFYVEEVDGGRHPFHRHVPPAALPHHAAARRPGGCCCVGAE